MQGLIDVLVEVLVEGLPKREHTAFKVPSMSWVGLGGTRQGIQEVVRVLECHEVGVFGLQI